MRKRKERRKPVKCPYCEVEMVCANRFESIYRQIKGFYVWYVCPRRRDEKGCGHSLLLGISPKSKSPGKIVSLDNLKERDKVKRKAKTRKRRS